MNTYHHLTKEVKGYYELLTSFYLYILVYPNSLVLIKMCSDCETCGLLNLCYTRGY